MDRLKSIKVDEMTYIKTDGGFSSTYTPNREADAKFVKDFQDRFNFMYESTYGTGQITSDPTEQCVFGSIVMEALLQCTEQCSRFSFDADKYGREISRYFVFTKESKYIVDVFANLDVKLVISNLHRFWLTHVPRKWSNINYNDIIPRILYRVNIWNTPDSRYQYTAFECPMQVEYTHKIEEARSLVGLPHQYSANERKAYERSDRDTRRVFFFDTPRTTIRRTSE